MNSWINVVTPYLDHMKVRCMLDLGDQIIQHGY